VPNAAKVVAALHAGQKRLVFAESRRTVEALAVALRGAGVEMFGSHSSLALDERRRAETAFAESRDCVIVATSTLELGVDVGDLDRVVQVGSPRTVASFLQRRDRFDDRYLRLSAEVGAGNLRVALREVRQRYGDVLTGVKPAVKEEAVRALKFADLLPPDLAQATLAARLGDHEGAGPVLRKAVLR
jgi:superfamily II DNA/RNA helicase